MEIAQITVEDMSADIILFHQFIIIMTLGTHVRRTYTKLSFCSLYIVNTMTIHACRHIRIAPVQQCLAMHTATIHFKHCAMTIGTSN